MVPERYTYQTVGVACCVSSSMLGFPLLSFNIRFLWRAVLARLWRYRYEIMGVACCKPFSLLGLSILSVNNRFLSMWLPNASDGIHMRQWAWLVVGQILCLVFPSFHSISGFFGERSLRASDGIDTR